ncbi:MAG: pyridoxal phosphate-dependent aminotransferase [Nitrospira sp.]
MTTSLMKALPFSERAERLIGQEMFKVMDRAQALEREGHTIYHLELGNPRMPPPHEIMEATLQAIQAKQVGYAPMAGIRELRDGIAERVSRQTDRRIEGNSIAISPANLIISQFLELTCNSRDRVVLFTPAFPSYWAAASHIGLTVIPVPLFQKNGFHLDESQIEVALAARPKAMIVNSANNPTGAVYTESMLRLLARRCDEERIWLLSDETYAEIAFGRPFFSLASCDSSQLVVMSSFSKVFSVPGYRVGYAQAHPAVVEKLALSTSTLISCLPIFTQVGCLAGLSVLDEYTEGVKAQCRRITAACADMVNRSGIVRCVVPESGFYLFVDISRTGLDDVTFCRRLLEERHTAVTPGRSFGIGCEGFVRIATCGWEHDVMEGTRRVVELAGELGVSCVKAA